MRARQLLTITLLLALPACSEGLLQPDYALDMGADANDLAEDLAPDLTAPDLTQDTGDGEDAPAAPDLADPVDLVEEPPPDPDLPPDLPADLPPDLPVEDEEPPAPRVTCQLTAPDPPEGYAEVNTWRAQVPRVRFVLDNLPDPALIEQATLRYHAWDADHTDAEGWIEVNQSPRLALPAEPALENQGRDFALDVTGRTVAGRNEVAFVAFDTPEGAFFRISQLSLELVGVGLLCPSPPAPTGQGELRELGYRAAAYAPRRNWVLNCRDYAYTARYDEHRACDDDYQPDGSGRGTATFVFSDVIADRYEVQIEGRHTENRNPAGALVIVNGVERRVSQIGGGEFAWGTHGTWDLEGEVSVILDSSREAGSDSVRRVRLVPVR